MPGEKDTSVMMMIAGRQVRQSLAGRCVERMKATDTAGRQVCLFWFFGHVAKYSFPVRSLENNSMFVRRKAVTVLTSTGSL
jgi:hypothetical protein